MKSRSLAAVLCCFAGSLLANAVSAEQIYSGNRRPTPEAIFQVADLPCPDVTATPVTVWLCCRTGLPPHRRFSIPLDHI